MIDNEQTNIYGAVLQNNGTALQPEIQFDDIQKRNVGVKTKVDLKFVKENPSPTPEFLKENVITEANVSLLTSLSNSITMPVAVEYMTKSGKDGIGMVNCLRNKFLSCIAAKLASRKLLLLKVFQSATSLYV